MIKVCVIGLGYVGLPVALGISSKFETLGFDISEKRIKELAVKFDFELILSFRLRNQHPALYFLRLPYSL